MDRRISLETQAKRVARQIERAWDRWPAPTRDALIECWTGANSYEYQGTDYILEDILNAFGGKAIWEVDSNLALDVGAQELFGSGRCEVARRYYLGAVFFSAATNAGPIAGRDLVHKSLFWIEQYIPCVIGDVELQEFAWTPAHLRAMYGTCILLQRWAQEVFPDSPGFEPIPNDDVAHLKKLTVKRTNRPAEVPQTPDS